MVHLFFMPGPHRLPSLLGLGVTLGVLLGCPLYVEASIAPVGSGYFVGPHKLLQTALPGLGPLRARVWHRTPSSWVLQRLLFHSPVLTAKTHPQAEALTLAELAQLMPFPSPDRPAGLAPVAVPPAVFPAHNSTLPAKPNENPADTAKQVEGPPVSPSPSVNGQSPPETPPQASIVALPPKPRLDYGTFHQWMSQLDELRQVLGEELALAQDLNSVSHEGLQEAQAQLSGARGTQSKLEQGLLNAINNGNDSATQDFDSLKNQFQSTRSSLFQSVLKVMPSQTVETRAIWLDRGSIIESGSPEGLRKLMGKLSRAGLNTIFFEALNAGYPLFNSPYLPKNPLLPKLPNGQHWDPLAVAVEEGHRLGMEVHAWVWCFAVGNTRHNQILGLPDQYPGPIITNRPADALRGVGGNLIPRQGKQTEFWLSPASPAAKDFLKNVMTDLVKTYPVDGVQLDYIRYPFQTAYTPGGRGLMGYEPIGRQRFELESGLSLGNLDDNTLRSFTAWKTAQVSQFVKDISMTLKAQRPGLKLSAAVYPMRREERILAIQQDWETWLANGWLDILCPMTYSRSVDGYNQALTDIDAAAPGSLLPVIGSPVLDKLAKLPTGQAFIYPGIALHRLDDATAAGMLRSSHTHGLLGNTLFAMVYLDEQRQKALQIGAYKLQPALPAHHEPLLGLLQVAKTFHTQCIFLSRRAGISPTEAVSGWGPVLEALTAWEKRLEALKVVQNSDNVSLLSTTAAAANSQFQQVQLALQPLMLSGEPKPVMTTPALVLPPLPHYLSSFLKGNLLRLDRLSTLVGRSVGSSLPVGNPVQNMPVARR